MKKLVLPILSAALAVSFGLLPILTSAQAQEPEKKVKIDFEKEIMPIVKASCIGCHNKDNAKANVSFADKMTLEEAKKNPRLWRRASKAVKSKKMPPKDHGTMSDKERKKFADWYDATFPKPAEPGTPPSTGGSTGGN